jgi:putative hydrolase of the HAD superfamily
VKYRAVVFDLWQTLVVFPHEEAVSFYRGMAQSLGVPYERFDEVWDRARPQRSLGPIAENAKAVCAELGFEGDVEELLGRRRTWVRRALLVPRTGAIETLAELRRRGHLLGLITVCSEHEAEVWEETPLAEAFDVTVFSCLVGVSKPDPRIYEIACERLDVEPEDCLFVGDGANDELIGAERAGMAAVQLRSPGEWLTPEAEAWPGARIETLEQLLTLV